MKAKIKAWLGDKYPNLIGSFDLVNPKCKPLPDIINDCIQDITPQWVSVVDGLPDNNIVLAANTEGAMELAICKKGLWLAVATPFGESEVDNTLDDVTHWQPLPEPPK